MDVWKEFEQNEITHSAAHHLMAIHDLLQGQGYARVSDVARVLNITRGSVSISLQPLKKAGLILQDENRHLRLSEIGNRLVDQIRAKRVVMQRLLTDLVGVAPNQAEIDACKIEHLISKESARRIVSLLRFFDSGDQAVTQFVAALRRFDPSCGGNMDACPSCQSTCLAESVRG